MSALRHQVLTSQDIYHTLPYADKQDLDGALIQNLNYFTAVLPLPNKYYLLLVFLRQYKFPHHARYLQQRVPRNSRQLQPSQQLLRANSYI